MTELTKPPEGRAMTEIDELKKRLQDDGDVLTFRQARQIRKRINLLEKKGKASKILDVNQPQLFQ